MDAEKSLSAKNGDFKMDKDPRARAVNYHGKENDKDETKH